MKISPIQKRSDEILSELETLEPYSDKYTTAVQNLERLDNLEHRHKKFKVSADTIAGGLFSLAGILMVIKSEQINVISSKAFGLISKVKI